MQSYKKNPIPGNSVARERSEQQPDCRYGEYHNNEGQCVHA